jgi:hypothetical protein
VTIIFLCLPRAPRLPTGTKKKRKERKRRRAAALQGAEAASGRTLPPDEPLTLVAYSAGPRKRAYVEPTAVGRELIDRPLFLDPDHYVNVPLEATYQAAYRGVPRRWRNVLEPPAS